MSLALAASISFVYNIVYLSTINFTLKFFIVFVTPKYLLDEVF